MTHCGCCEDEIKPSHQSVCANKNKVCQRCMSDWRTYLDTEDYEGFYEHLMTYTYMDWMTAGGKEDAIKDWDKEVGEPLLEKRYALIENHAKLHTFKR